MREDILIVDDEADIRLLIEGVLQDEGYATRTAASSQNALMQIATRQPSLILLDIWLQNSQHDGLELLKILRREHPDIAVVMISGHGNVETAVSAIRSGALDYIEKPFKADRLLLAVAHALERSRLRRENAQLRLQGLKESEFVGGSPIISNLRQAIGKVAPTNSRIMITGPAGAGKEVAARQVHMRSRRNEGSLVILNCATMHPDRIEAELFGVEAGYGDNGAAKIGTLERAHGGTLLLDEVADMPLETQGKIVRVLQEQTFERFGGSSRVEVDVRVIASSNRSLPELVRDGQFREDLYYRLNVVPLVVPALQDRREDIPKLAEYFVERASGQAGLPRRRFSHDALAALQAYSWPGNVRQLRNVVEWMLIMAPGSPEEPLRADMLPPDLTAQLPAALSHGGGDDIMGLPLREARETFERQYLEAQITRFGGNISRTAGFVGMERSALHRKLRSLGINTSER